MLTRRLIPVVLFREGLVVQSQNFSEYLPIGRPEIAVKYLTDWGADEILLIDIDASKSGKSPNFSLIEACANSSNIPLTVGGGISSAQDARRIFDSGADKISINAAASNNLFSEVSVVFGAQAVVLAIDTKVVNGAHKVFDYRLNLVRELSVLDFVTSFNDSLYGEIMIQSVDRDGSKTGYELSLYRKVADKIDKPIIALGGYGSPADLETLFGDTSVSAAAIGNSLHHYEHALIAIKSKLDKSLNVRNETEANYRAMQFDSNSRIRKLSEVYLKELLYKRISQEVI
jgi:cyclase